MTKKKPHIVEVIIKEVRYRAQEIGGTIHLSRDGSDIGKAAWSNDQLTDSTAVLPDEAVEALEKKLKERIDNHWDDP
jgi:hypothetical protein